MLSEGLCSWPRTTDEGEYLEAPLLPQCEGGREGVRVFGQMLACTLRRISEFKLVVKPQEEGEVRRCCWM